MHLRAWFIKITQITWYFFAAVLISSAVLVSTARLVTPLLNQHRADFEKWASTLLDAPITIGEIHADWRGYIPEFSLYHVVTFDKNTHKPAFGIQEIHIGFRLFTSLWQRAIVLQDIIISGAHVTILQDGNGKFSIKDLPVKQSEDYNAYEMTDILDWIFTQHYIALRNIDVEFIKNKSQKQNVTFKKMAFWNETSQHKIQSNILLHQEIATEIKSNIEWIGSIRDTAHIKGHAHFNLEGFSLPQWLAQENFSLQSLGGWQIRNGIGGADIWLDWENQALRQAQSIFQWYDLEFYSTYDKKIYPIQRFSGHIGWRKEGNKHIFAGDDLLIDFPDHFWPATTFYVAVAMDESRPAKRIALPMHTLAKKLPYDDIDLSHLITNPLDLENELLAAKYKLEEVRFGYLDIQDVLPIVLANADFPAQWRQYLAKLKPTGNLQNFSLAWHGDLLDFEKLLASGSVKQLSFQPWQNFPGINNLTGIGAWDGKGGNFRLDSVGLTIYSPTWFAQPIILDNASSYIVFERNPEDSWTFEAKKINLNNAEVNLNATSQLTLFHVSPAINFKGDFSIIKAERISSYLPTKIMDKELVDWMKTAFVSGKVDSGKIVVQGELKDFPFAVSKPIKNTHKNNQNVINANNKNGIFEISGRIKDTDFRFAPDWPLVRQANGSILFSGYSMNIVINSAFIFDVPLQKVTGNIPDLNADRPVLTVQSDIKTNFARALEFIHQSPLEETIGKDLATIEMQGPMSLDLALTVPIR
jgi:uncharacterized protein YhdP